MQKERTNGIHRLGRVGRSLAHHTYRQTPAPASELKLQALTSRDAGCSFVLFYFFLFCFCFSCFEPLGSSPERAGSQETGVTSVSRLAQGLPVRSEKARLDGSLELGAGLFLRHWDTRQEAELPVNDLLFRRA